MAFTKQILHYLLGVFLLAVPIKGFSQEVKPTVDSLQLSVLLSKAILNNDTLKADSLILTGMDVNIAANEGVTPLMYAAEEGNLHFIEKLLQVGADVNQLPGNKVTALQSAIIANKVEAAELLLQNSANLNTKDQWGNTPVLNAAQNNSPEMLRLLLRWGADVNHANSDGNTALHYATVFGNDSLVTELMDAGAKADLKDKQGFTTLMVATSENFNSAAELLVSYGADLNAVNDQGYSALSIAILNGNVYLAELFLLNGANGNLLAREAKDHWYFSKGTGKYMRKVLREAEVKRNLSPVLEDWAGGAKFGWTESHLTTGILVGVRETKYNFWLQAAFGVTPFVYSTLTEIGGKKYQFWQRDYRLAIEADKYFAFHKSFRTEWGIWAGVETGFDFGSYRGTGFKPSSEVNVFPTAGVFWRQGFTETRLGYKKNLFQVDEAGEWGIQFHFYFGRM
ncbi:ankyrin repeat domain-containing protein [Maribellus sp. CM-23]|uniref:ankyrin repeat domain-containing protein n=1 Tax=Maribellus sp. CM-23 TaxID=2781026 RepID=UPI001F3FE1A3|nr:ankyrin repeat domain-containing protein [Maribellus sp. CM-23]MCE4566054.1 ankyrin repeat domain-containing protein [Maribellus sp. CM-23]